MSRFGRFPVLAVPASRQGMPRLTIRRSRLVFGVSIARNFIRSRLLANPTMMEKFGPRRSGRSTISLGQHWPTIIQHHFLLPANASFNVAANALVTAAITLNYKTMKVDTICAILQARGFTVTN